MNASANSAGRNTLASTQGSIRTSATTDRMRLSTGRGSMNAMENILADDTLGRDQMLSMLQSEFNDTQIESSFNSCCAFPPVASQVE